MTTPTPFISRHLIEDTERNCPLSAVEINADAETIWAELEQFDQWEGWNPLYVESSGVLSEGNTLQFAVQLPDMSPQRGSAEVVKVQPREFIRYEIRSMGGLIRGVRFIEIQQLAPNCCLLANGEIMGGLLGPVLCKFMGERVRQGLESMNLALKARLENPI